MLNRLAGHSLEIMDGDRSKSNKYRVLFQAFLREDCKCEFDCLHSMDELDLDELGELEAFYINKYMPPLNYQIPKIGDYKHYTVNKRAKYITLAEILDPAAEVFIF